MRVSAMIAVLSVFACLYPASEALARDSGGFSDEAVEKAIARGVKYLWSRQAEDGSFSFTGKPDSLMTAHKMGYSALPVYALLESGVSHQDPRMVKVLKWLEKTSEHKTYSLGVRANVWLVVSRKNPKYRKLLRKDVKRLYRSTGNGAYSYDCNADGKSAAVEKDNSASQYAVLGVWAGARANVEVPRKYWDMVAHHWRKSQNRDGGWGYIGSPDQPTRPTMVAAGVATMFVCFDNIKSARFASCSVDLAKDRKYQVIKRGLDWFDRNFVKTTPAVVLPGEPKWSPYYFNYWLYGVERVGLASGYKYFGQADWYKLGATNLIDLQKTNGSWAGKGQLTPEVNTAFALLFLVRGRQPVLFNKLQFDGDWNNRPRELASVTRWISRIFEATVNWQIINTKVPVSEWHDAPILYISACRKVSFSDAELRKLRDFVWQGGTIFSCTECGGAGFKDGIRKVYAKLFPQYEMVPLAPEHDLYSIHFNLKGKPKFHAITNGVRPLVIHTDVDLPLHWQLRRRATSKWAYQAAANVAMYVTDKGSLRHRGVRHWPEPPDFTPRRTVRLARLKHSGNYDPEPLAYERFARLMGLRTQTKVEVSGPIDIEKLPASGVDLATLTGTARLNLSNKQKSALKKFIAAGGTVLIDAAGGSKKFADSAEKLLDDLFGPGSVRRLSARSEIYQLKGMEIEKARYRRRTRKFFPNRLPNLSAVQLNRRPAVILSREDITGALVGYPSYSCLGYDPQTAFELMRNILLFAAERRAK